MANEVFTTIVGNATADPELRFLNNNNGTPVCNLTIASTERVFDRDTQEWKDADQALFLRCNIWRGQAENVAESISKGDRVIAYGKLKQRSYEKDGEKRTAYELEVLDIGPALLYATAQVSKKSKGGGQRVSVAQAADNFAAAGAFTPSSSEPPF